MNFVLAHSSLGVPACASASATTPPTSPCHASGYESTTHYNVRAAARTSRCVCAGRQEGASSKGRERGGAGAVCFFSSWRGAKGVQREGSREGAGSSDKIWWVERGGRPKGRGGEGRGTECGKKMKACGSAARDRQPEGYTRRGPDAVCCSGGLKLRGRWGGEGTAGRHSEHNSKLLQRQSRLCRCSAWQAALAALACPTQAGGGQAGWPMHACTLPPPPPHPHPTGPLTVEVGLLAGGPHILELLQNGGEVVLQPTLSGSVSV